MYTTTELQQRFYNYLQANVFTKAPKELYEPVDYILSLGGKRMRPILLLRAYDMFGDEEVEAALPAAMAVEVFHNFSLLHDDIMDDAPLRRGKPTVHEKWNANTAILSGDVMLIEAYRFLMKTDKPGILPKLLHRFNTMAVQVCEGQQYDMNFETRTDVTVAEYLKMIEYKTAVLLAASMYMGALIGGAQEEDAHHLSEFGRNIGIAFQLQDDILDSFGDPEKFGKKVGGDISRNKKTYLLLRAYEQADARREKELDDWMASKEEPKKIPAVKAIYREMGVKKDAEQTMRTYAERAYEHLELVSIASKYKQPLRQMAEELMQRES